MQRNSCKCHKPSDVKLLLLPLFLRVELALHSGKSISFSPGCSSACLLFFFCCPGLALAWQIFRRLSGTFAPRLLPAPCPGTQLPFNLHVACNFPRLGGAQKLNSKHWNGILLLRLLKACCNLYLTHTPWTLCKLHRVSRLSTNKREV